MPPQADGIFIDRCRMEMPLEPQEDEQEDQFSHLLKEQLTKFTIPF